MEILWSSIPARVFKGERCQGFVAVESIEMHLGLKIGGGRNNFT